MPIVVTQLPSIFQLQSQMQPQPRSFTLRTLADCQVLPPHIFSPYYQINIKEGPALRLHFLTDSIIRLRLTFDPARQFREQSYSLVTTAWEDRLDQVLGRQRRRVQPIKDVGFELRTDQAEGEYYHFETRELIGRIYKQPYGMHLYNRQGDTIYQDVRGRAYKRDLRGRVHHYSQLQGRDQEMLYGLGENTGRLNKNGQRVRLAPHGQLGYDAESSSPMSKHIPFYVKLNKKTQHALGLYYHNSHEAVFDLGCEGSAYWPRYGCYSAEGGDVDLFLINGPTIKRVLKNYTDLTGKTALAPINCLGYLGSTMYYAQMGSKCDEAILGFVKKCKQELVPISNFHLSSGYTLSEDKASPKRHVFTWNSQKFPNPPGFFDSMKHYGVTVSPNVKPGLLLTHPLYEQFKNSNAFVKSPQDCSQPYVDKWWGGHGSFVDFTNPKCRQLWKKHLKSALISKGTTSIWNDNNQYQSLDDRSSVCSHQHPNVQAGYGLLDYLQSIQPLLMCYTARIALEQQCPSFRPYIVSRAGCAGLQRYASSWSGDNYTSWSALRASIPTVLSMSLSGFANYGSDVGGFWGPAPEGELLLRWVQSGVFQPRFSIYSCNQDNTVTQPWMHPQFAAIVARTIRFRYALLPYLYSLMFYSHLKGYPIVRPLIYEFQYTDVDGCAQESQEFMLGPSVLVASVLEPQSQMPKAPANGDRISLQPLKFPTINYLVPNCVEMNQSQYWNSQTRSLNANPSINKHSAKLFQKVNSESAYKEVYLPRGCNWYSWNGRCKYPGGTTISVKVNLESIPLFVRDRSIVPLAVNFGTGAQFDMTKMNRQQISGLYVKICYDNESGVEFPHTKKALQFLMFEDDGYSPLNNPDSSVLSGSQQNPGKMPENRINGEVSTDASYLLTKFSVKYDRDEQTGLENESMLMISINRQGNLQKASSLEQLILEIKSIDKSPLWISLNKQECTHYLYESDWVKWRHDSKNDRNENDAQNEGELQPGCWYYDHDKGAAVLKINKNIVRPSAEETDRYRVLDVCVCKDRFMKFDKQYMKMDMEK